jgi:hypothetical protein
MLKGMACKIYLIPSTAKKVMRKIFLAFFILMINSAFSQKAEDNRILVTVSDTSKLYERTRQAIVNTNFIIREDSNRDTLVTSTERIGNSSIFAMAKVIINNNTVEISGAYGLGYVDFWGFPGWPSGYSRINYYKESESWKLLRQIAIKLDGKISYYKVK